MDAETKIRNRATGIVLDEDRRFRRGGKGRGFLTLVPGEKDEERRTRETDKLTSWLESALKGKNPELLDNIKDEDIRKAYVEGTDPTVASKKLEFSAFKDLIEPKKGKRSWYDMNTEQLKYAMKERGFNEKEMPEFLQTLSEHQQNYDIGKAVDEDLSGAGGVAKSLLFPTATKEAVRQSFEKDSAPRPGAMAGASFIDAAVLGGMLLSPGAKELNTASDLANIARLFGTDAGLEAARQSLDATLQGGTDMGDAFDRARAAFSAGITSATVPAMSTYIGRYLTQGGSAASKLSRGFRRGSKGGVDPVKAEAEAIKASLIDAKKQSKAAYGIVTEGLEKNLGLRSNTGRESWATFGDIDQAGQWNRGKKILSDLGYPSLESALIGKAIRSAEKSPNPSSETYQAAMKLDDIISGLRKDPTNKPYELNLEKGIAPRQDMDLDEAIRNVGLYSEPNYIDVGTSQGSPMRNPGEPIYVEDIIGWRPGSVHGVKGQPGYSEKWAEPRYDVESIYNELTGGNPLARISLENELMSPTGTDIGERIIARYSESAPEAAAAKKLSGSKAYRTGIMLGRAISGLGTRLEPAGLGPIRIDLEKNRKTAIDEALERIEDEQLRAAIEKALKGGKK